MTCPPIVFLIFNRPEHTARSFEMIRAVRPSRLLVIADGPRAAKAGEAELCRQTRAVIDAIDWPCEVSRNFAEENMGCGRRVASGITWAFTLVDKAIILEDDCVPDLSFFPFCDALLNRFADDERVMMISGNNFQDGIKRGDASYYFSRLPHCWGWATWRRAWEHFDYDMQGWHARRETDWLKRIAGHRLVEAVWEKEFDEVATGKVDTWDFQWKYCVWSNDGLAVVPNANLVTNIGFGQMATHTFEADQRQIVQIGSVQLPLLHPPSVTACDPADEFEKRRLFRLPRFAIFDPFHFAFKSFGLLLRPALQKIGVWDLLRSLATRR